MLLSLHIATLSVFFLHSGVCFVIVIIIIIIISNHFKINGLFLFIQHMWHNPL